MSDIVRPMPPSQAVLVAVDLMRGDPGAWKTARGAVGAQAVLMLRGLHTEARAVQSVAHMQREMMLLTLTGIAEQRGQEAHALLARDPQSELYEPCGRLCTLYNQGPCACVVPVEVARLRRRQRGLLWAIEVIMRGDP